MMKHLLVVDDDRDTGELLCKLAADCGYTAVAARSLRDARRELATHAPNLVFLDLFLPDGRGIELLNGDSLGDADAVLITGNASLETSIEALRLGAADYLIKPVNPEQVAKVLQHFARPEACKAQIRQVKETKGVREAKEPKGIKQEPKPVSRFGVMWGASDAMKRVYEQVARVAPTSVTVLVQGESGTGKELVAQSIHDLSRRRALPFLAINCGAISPQLMESEIFGHEKGSFTGAERQHKGFFERAHGGTLFLDEVTEMPLDLQVKLLRVLETGTFNRVGATQMQQADVRIIAATNRVPDEAVRSGKLREDLLYRLDVFPIRLPPLRERAGDVPLLADHFLAEISAAEGEEKRFSTEAHEQMDAYGWPGNVRELRNVVQRAFVMTSGAVIRSDWLALADVSAGEKRAPALRFPLGTSLAAVERALILATLELNGARKERTAAQLGVSLKTLYNRLKEYGEESGNTGLAADLPSSPPPRSQVGQPAESEAVA